MTKTIFQNWKVIAGLSIAAVLLGSVFSFGLFTPKAEAGENGTFPGESFPTACLFNEVKHWDKIIFQILRDPSGVIMSQYLKTPLDIKVLDEPSLVANIDAKIRDFIIVHGIANVPPFDPDDPDNITDEIVAKLKIDIIDVEYAIVCVTTGLSNGGT